MENKIFKIDHYDRKILFELDSNARTRATEIGKKIRKSKQFVDYRIKRLEYEKILGGYTAVIDYSKMGYISIRVYLKFHSITREKQEEIENDLMKDRQVWWLVAVDGQWDVAYAVGVKNVLDFYGYWDGIMAKYRKVIKKKSVVIYTHIRQYPKSCLLNKNNDEKGTLVGASKDVLVLDSMDLRLLKILSDNARIPLLDIANKLHTSPQVARAHIKKLEKNEIILGYKALINIQMLSYRYYKSYINLASMERIASLERFCLQHPNILNVNRTIGGSDFEIEILAKSFNEFE